MKKNRALQLGALAIAIVVMGFTLIPTQQKAKHKRSEKKPNVLFILADDLGINATHCYGSKVVESPNIDKLYDEGMHFTNGYSNDPTCAPSRASIMSGQYVPRHKVYRVADRYKNKPNTLHNMKYLPPPVNKVKGAGVGMNLDRITIAEALKANGYVTAAYGKWHLGHGKLGVRHQGFDHGFEMTGHYTLKTDPKQNYPTDKSLYSSDLVTDSIIKFMRNSVKAGEPFFAYVPYYLVHKPLEPKPEYLAYFKKKYEGSDEVGPKEIKVLAMIKSLDENVGQLMAALKELGIDDNTIVIFASDNGHYKTESNIFNQPYRGVKGQTYEGGIRVPYIFRWNNHIKPKSESTEPIIHVDIYPTILGLTKSKPAKDYILDGEDLSPILYGKATKTKRDALVWEYTNYARYNIKRHSFASEWVNVIQMDGFKMTEVIESGDYYLYNLNNDPYETKEVSAEYPKEIAKLKARLEQWKKETGYQAPVPNPDYAPTK